MTDKKKNSMGIYPFRSKIKESVEEDEEAEEEPRKIRRPLRYGVYSHR